MIPTSPNAADGRVVRFLNRPDVARHRLRYTARRLSYEFQRRYRPDRLGHDRIVGFDDDLLLFVHLDDLIERSIYLYGYHEFRSAALFNQLTSPGMGVVDAGAHVGQFTLLAAKRVGSQGRVLSFEPNPTIRARLLSNVELNEFTNVTVVPTALADRAEHAWLHVPVSSDNSGTCSLQPRPNTTAVPVETETLDGALARLCVDEIGLIKLDVEGSEREVLEGSLNLLRSSRPGVVFEVNSNEDGTGSIASDAMELLQSLGYQLFGMRPSRNGVGVSLEALKAGANPAEFREPWQALNLVAIHSDSTTNARSLVRDSRPAAVVT